MAKGGRKKNHKRKIKHLNPNYKSNRSHPVLTEKGVIFAEKILAAEACTNWEIKRPEPGLYYASEEGMLGIGIYEGDYVTVLSCSQRDDDGDFTVFILDVDKQPVQYNAKEWLIDTVSIGWQGEVHPLPEDFIEEHQINIAHN